MLKVSIQSVIMLSVLSPSSYTSSSIRLIKAFMVLITGLLCVVRLKVLVCPWLNGLSILFDVEEEDLLVISVLNDFNVFKMDE